MHLGSLYKRVSGFTFPAGKSEMSLTKISLAGNNLPSPTPWKVWSKQVQESLFTVDVSEKNVC